jgi:uncharacterized protein
MEITKYLLSYDPPLIDFLFPDNNFDNRPFGKQTDFEATPYGDWLMKVFDYWFNSTDRVRVRLFNNIIRLIFGKSSLVETLGLEPSRLITIETNGDFEGLDVLKTTYQRATKLGYNVFEHDLDTVSMHPSIKMRQVGISGLHQKCKECALVNICGGGYLPHRYSSKDGFNNPSVYCSDLMKLIHHIYASVNNEIIEIRQR